VLGTETFGKGSVQTIIPLDDGSGLRLTTALYYLPSGRSIQERRIQPDVEVEGYTQAEVEVLQNSEERPARLGEEDLEGHFQAPSGETPQAAPQDPAEESREDLFARQRELDRQLTRAVDLLKSWSVFSKLQAPSPA
jgi:carboxyl-terminal processing protease